MLSDDIFYYRFLRIYDLKSTTSHFSWSWRVFVVKNGGKRIRSTSNRSKVRKNQDSNTSGDFWLPPRLRSGPKFSSDQFFQTEIISDQTFQTEINHDQFFQTQWPCDQIFRPKVFWSDHLRTMVQTQIQTIAQILIRLWSDSSALEEVMIRPSSARSFYGQNQLHLQPFVIRLKCARIRFWSELSAREKVWWSDFLFIKTDVFSI